MHARACISQISTSLKFLTDSYRLERIDYELFGIGYRSNKFLCAFDFGNLEAGFHGRNLFVRA